MTKEEVIKELEELGYMDETCVPCNISTPFLYSVCNSNIIFFHFLDVLPIWVFKWENNAIYRKVLIHPGWIENDANMSIATMIVLYL